MNSKRTEIRFTWDSLVHSKYSLPLFSLFSLIFASNFSQLSALNTVASKNFRCEWRNTKSVTPINPLPHPNCPNLLERHSLKSDMSSLLSIEQTTHRNQNNDQLYWNAWILLCIVVDPWHFGMNLDSRIQITDLWIRILLFMQVVDKMPTKNKFFYKVLCLYISPKIKSQKEVTK